MIDPLEIGNVGTVPERLKQAHAVISAEQESQGYQGDQQIQGKRQPKMTEKGREYRLSTLENKRARLISRLLRKSSEIDDLMYSYQNSITVKEELAQLNDMFKMLVDIHEEFKQIDKEYTDDIWFDDIDQKVFSFKHKVHNWLKEEEKEYKKDHSSRSSIKSSSSKSKSSTREKAVEEKLRVAELIAEASFMKKRKDAEYQAEALRMEEELAKARARAKVYDDMEGIDLGIGKDAEVFLPKKFGDNEVTSTNMQQGVAFEKTKSRQSGYRTLYPELKFKSPIYPSWSNAYDQQLGSSYQCCDTDPEKVGSQSKEEATHENQNEDRSTSRRRQERSVHENDNAAEMLSKLVREQSAPQVDMEPFEGNPLDFTYFMSMFQESVEKKIDDPRGRLTRLIKYTRGEPQELVKHFINDRADCGYKNAIALLQKQYGNPHTMLSSYRKEIKLMQPLKPGDAAAFRKLFNFLIKCQTMRVGSKRNPLDTPEMICMILAKLPLHLQDRWNRNTLLLRRRDSREPTLIDLANFVEDEMTLVNDPLYSREAVRQYLEKGPTRQAHRGDRRKFHTMATKTDNSTEG